MSERSALILGASGLTGGRLLAMLLADERYTRIVSPGRRKLEIEHHKLTQINVTLDQLQTRATDFAVDDIYCTLGTTHKKAGSKEAFEQVDYHAPLLAAKLGQEHGAKQFLVVTSMGADAKATLSNYLRAKGRLEEELQKLSGYHALHIFRPSLLLGSRGEARLGEDLGKGLAGVIGWLVPAKYKAIEADQVARAMLLTAHRADSGQHVYENDALLTMR